MVAASGAVRPSGVLVIGTFGPWGSEQQFTWANVDPAVPTTGGT